MNRIDYTTSKEKKKSGNAMLMIIFVLIGIAIGTWELPCYREPTGWDVCYPMTNASMQWAYTGDARCQP